MTRSLQIEISVIIQKYLINFESYFLQIYKKLNIFLDVEIHYLLQI